mgnify:CR=1 FL=1
MPGNEKFTEEKLIMQYLREDYHEFPQGKLIKSESPDFILRSSRKSNTGIEMTRLHENGNHHTGTDNKSNQRMGDLLEEARKIFEQQNRTNLYLKCFFNHEKLPDKSEINFLARFLAVYIEKSIAEMDLKKYFQIDINSRLPDAIDNLHIIHHPAAEVSLWDYGRTYLLYDLQKEMLEENIRKKEEKLVLYRKNRFDQYWLVLVTMKLNTMKNFNIFNKLDEWSFQTAFDRILLYELFEQRAYQLNLD